MVVYLNPTSMFLYLGSNSRYHYRIWIKLVFSVYSVMSGWASADPGPRINLRIRPETGASIVKCRSGVLGSLSGSADSLVRVLICYASPAGHVQ